MWVTFPIALDIQDFTVLKESDDLRGTLPGIYMPVFKKNKTKMLY